MIIYLKKKICHKTAYESFLLFYLCFLKLSVLHGESDEHLLSRLRDAILVRFNEIHKKQTTEPKGIWYANKLATLFYDRGMSLLPEEWTGYLTDDAFEKTNIRVFQLRRGVSATRALENVVGGLSILDCGNATQLVYYLAISDIIGKEAFDSYVARSPKPLYISVYTEYAPTDSVLFDFLDEVNISSPSVENERPLTVGQLVYFRNYLSYIDKHPTGHGQGFNTIYVGRNHSKDQTYMAFWKGPPKTEKEVIELLKTRFNEPEDMWDKLYFAKFPDRKVAAKIDPNHQFFEDKKVFSYVFNLQLIRSLMKPRIMIAN